MNWLITGGCGFIGTALIKSLLQTQGENIRVVDNLLVGTRADLAGISQFREIEHVDAPPDGVELVVVDIRDRSRAVEACRGCDVVVHLAANTGVGPSVEDPRIDCEVNVIGTFNYLDAARKNGIKRFIFASSGAPVGEVQPPIHEEMPPHPVSPYGASKLAGEAYCSAYAHSFGLDTVALRFGNVYGPGSAHKASVVAKFLKLAMDGQPLEIFGDGGQTRDFIYIDDLVEAILLASRAPAVGGEIFQIATNHETTVSEITAKLASILNTLGVRNVVVKNTEARVGDVRRNYSDTSKAKVRLGWQAHTSLDEGLLATAAYFKKNRS